MKIKIFKFNENVIEPRRAHYDDAGLDCYSLQDYVLKPNTPTLIPLGFGLDIPNGYVVLIKPRSSMNVKGVLTQEGIIDSGYKGEIKAVLINLTNNDIKIEKGNKICQLITHPVTYVDVSLELGLEREQNGFGSTGK